MISGADLFFEMMKAVYPDPGASSESLREMYQQAGQKLFGEMPAKAMVENTEAFFKSWMEGVQGAYSAGESPVGSEIQDKMMQSIVQNGSLYVQFMKSVFEAAQTTNAGEDSEEKLNEIHNKMSQHLLDLYQNSVGKYLAAPQFGIPREALQQLNNGVSAYHKFMGALGDFSVMFSKPLKRSMDVLRKALEDQEETGEGFNSARDVYNFAVKIFDKEYDVWLKSPEGVQSVANIVDKYLEYKQNLNPVRDTWFKSLSIPTKKEMADVYRGIYDLRKKSRQQDAIIREQADSIKKLNRKIKKLETLLAESLPKKKTAKSGSTKIRKKKKDD